MNRSGTFIRYSDAMKSRPKTMRSLAKSTLERLSGYQVWCESSSELSDVDAFIGQLAPIAIERPLIRVGGAHDGGLSASR